MRANVVIAIQSREAQLLKDIAPEREVILAGIDLDVVPATSRETRPHSIAVVALGQSTECARSYHFPH